MSILNYQLLNRKKMYEIIKLYVTDHGDPSVGINLATWTVEAPANKEETQELEWFKGAIIEVYKEAAQGRVTACYDFEIDKM